MTIQPASTLPEPLTSRELDVLRLMASGMSNAQISEELVIGVETVRWYTKQIYSKLGVHSRTQASLRARDFGLIQPQVVRAARKTAVAGHNLPNYATAFVGREQELNELVRLLADPQVRLVTITGPGGMGKTRLSVEAARVLKDRFADGIVFAPLAAVDTAVDIVPTVARMLQLRLHAGEATHVQLLRFLYGKRLLLILDNCEHLPQGVELARQILHDTQSVNILVTSRSALNLAGEWVRPLKSLPSPASGSVANLDDYHAVQLFLARARQVRADFALADNRACVAEICRLVQGMPLALELAATWLKILSCGDIVAEIQHSLDFLATTHQDVAERHQSIRAVFGTSWALLTDEERGVLKRLSMFRGGFGRLAAEQVAGASLTTLSSLVDKSWLRQNTAGDFEFHDLLRQYVEDQLAQATAGTLTTRSGQLLSWSRLIKGDFERAGELARDILARKEATPPAEEAFGLALTGILAGMEEDYERCWQLCTAALALTHKTDVTPNPITLIFIHLGLAVAGCGLSDYAAASAHSKQALALAGALHSPAFVKLCLPPTAVVRAHKAEAETAVELLGLAATPPGRMPAWMQAWPLLAQLRTDLAGELGQPAFDQCWSRGQNLALNTILETAVD